MKRLLLFSHVTIEAQQNVFPLLFPEELPRKVFACMPSDGALRGRSYTLFCESWRTIAEEHNAEFLYLDNSKGPSLEEQAKLQRATILLITGGNACVLLRNVRQSGLDKSILAFAQREQCVLAGYSAGAMLFTPTVRLAAFEPWLTENRGVELTNFDALHLVDFEVFPHFSPETQPVFERYVQQTPYPVKPLADDEYLCIQDFSCGESARRALSPHEKS